MAKVSQPFLTGIFFEVFLLILNGVHNNLFFRRLPAHTSLPHEPPAVSLPLKDSNAM